MSVDHENVNWLSDVEELRHKVDVVPLGDSVIQVGVLAAGQCDRQSTIDAPYITIRRRLKLFK